MPDIYKEARECAEKIATQNFVRLSLKGKHVDTIAALISAAMAEREAAKRAEYELTDQQRAAQWIKEFEDLRRVHEVEMRQRDAKYQELLRAVNDLLVRIGDTAGDCPHSVKSLAVDVRTALHAQEAE